MWRFRIRAIWFKAGAKRRAQGFGPVGKGGATRGLMLHPVLALDAVRGEVVGLAGAELWNRTGGKKVKAKGQARAGGEGVASLDQRGSDSGGGSGRG